METRRWLVFLEEGLSLLRQRLGRVADQLPALAPQHVHRPHGHFWADVEEERLLLVGGHVYLVVAVVDGQVVVVAGEHEVGGGLYL